MSDWYRKLGVSAHKSFLEGLPHTRTSYFVPVGPDIAGEESYRFALHADGVGTKGILAYLWWKETGDPTVWAALAQDALVMNTDDLACIGATEGFVFSTTLTRNPKHIPDEIVRAIIEGVYAFVEKLNSWGIPAWVAGGETADMPDVVRTVGLEATAAVRLPLSRLLSLRRPDREVLIVGLASFGQASYEDAYNSGVGCNGLTALRHLLLAPTYAEKYPESVAPELPTPYQGTYHLSDAVGAYRLGELLTSPTRTYLPILREVYAAHRKAIYGVVHCTGGGQRKALKYFPHTLIRKEHFFPLPPLFHLLEGLRPWPDLFEVLNMGHRMELYVLPEVGEEVIAIAERYGVAAQLIGTAQPADHPSRIEASFKGLNWTWSV
uniref:Phosphoribosylformylglycinamidine cyclo-ligase n=1 Tax=uncultured Bacteroidota bacterium TaxID=152509 RepID=H5SGK1_9BACT|nr:phosphoribosylformylglycinamidine cyclo-ligase [uncultured Bacteroidetes bacterium]